MKILLQFNVFILPFWMEFLEFQYTKHKRCTVCVSLCNCVSCSVFCVLCIEIREIWFKMAKTKRNINFLKETKITNSKLFVINSLTFSLFEGQIYTFKLCVRNMHTLSRLFFLVEYPITSM